MPTGAVLLVRIASLPGDEALAALRQDFTQAIGLNPQEDFYTGGPLLPIRDHTEDPVPVDDGVSRWLNVNLWNAYYGKGYHRGDLPLFIRCAEWLEVHLPGCEVWYGHDVDDENLRPFGPAQREEWWSYFRAVSQRGGDRSVA